MSSKPILFNVQEITNGIFLGLYPVLFNVKCVISVPLTVPNRKTRFKHSPFLPFLSNQVAPPQTHAIGRASVTLCPFGPFKHIAEITPCTFKHFVCHPRSLIQPDSTSDSTWLFLWLAKLKETVRTLSLCILYSVSVFLSGVICCPVVILWFIKYLSLKVNVTLLKTFAAVLLKPRLHAQSGVLFWKQWLL